jgi:hypothetical protein
MSIKSWNLLIYLAADNNLKEECVYTLTDIFHQVKSDLTILERINVVVLFDSGAAITQYAFAELGTDSSIDTITKLGRPFVSEAEAAQARTSVDLIKAFLMENIEKSEDVHNVIILSGHGGGVVGDVLLTNNPPSSLSIPQLGDLIESVKERLGRPVDVLGMDSCMMSMAEVAYELRRGARYLIGSEGFEINTGWPYGRLLNDLKKELRNGANISPAEFACGIVRGYIGYYSDYYVSGVSVDQAVTDLANIGNVKTAVGELAGLLMANINDEKVKNSVILAHWKAQSYKRELYVDLWDFCRLLRDHCGSGEIAIACQTVINVIHPENPEKTTWQGGPPPAVMLSCYSGAAFQHSHGLSIYFPWAKTDIDFDYLEYQNLAFAEATAWGEFIKVHGDATLRELRVPVGNETLHTEPLKMPEREEFGFGVKDAPALHLKDAPALHLKGLLPRMPVVKNMPIHFYPDECKPKSALPIGAPE